MKFKSKYLSGVVAALTTMLGLTMFSTVSHATSTAGPAFTVQALTGKHNNVGSSGYFNLKVKPNEQKILRIKIINSSKKAGKYDISLNNAVTNSNGVVDFTKSVKKSPYLKLGLTDVVNLHKKQVVSVPAKSSKTFSYKMKVPNIHFRGIVLGGFLVAPHNAVKNALANNKKQKKPSTIVSTFQYVVGVKLYQSKLKVEPNVKFFNASYGLAYSLPSLKFDIANTAPTTAKIPSGYVNIKNTKGKVVYYKKLSNLSFAPNSRFTFINSLEAKQLAVGKYKTTLHLKGQELNYNYSHWFTVTQKNQQTVDKNGASYVHTKTKQNYFWVWIIAAIALAIVIALVSYIIHLKKKSNVVSTHNDSDNPKK